MILANGRIRDPAAFFHRTAAEGQLKYWPLPVPPRDIKAEYDRGYQVRWHRGFDDDAHQLTVEALVFDKYRKINYDLLQALLDAMTPTETVRTLDVIGSPTTCAPSWYVDLHNTLGDPHRTGTSESAQRHSGPPSTEPGGHEPAGPNPKEPQ